MSSVKEVKPSYEETQSAASYYFYSEYDPTNHFNYDIVFEKDGTTPNTKETDKNKAKAYAKAIEYHFLQEQTLPIYDNDDTHINYQYINFYTPILNNGSPAADYNIDFSEITEASFDTNYVNYFNEIFVKTSLLTSVETLRSYQYYKYEADENGSYLYDEEIEWYRPIESGEQGTFRKTDITVNAEEELTSMNIYKLIDVYNCIQNLTQTRDNRAHRTEFDDATKINKEAYNMAIYVHITRPIGQSADHFIKTIKNVNKIFQFKLQTDPGWYKYNKYNKLWEYIEFAKEVENNG